MFTKAVSTVTLKYVQSDFYSAKVFFRMEIKIHKKKTEAEDGQNFRHIFTYVGLFILKCAFSIYSFTYTEH